MVAIRFRDVGPMIAQGILTLSDVFCATWIPKLELSVERDTFFPLPVKLEVVPRVARDNQSISTIISFQDQRLRWSMLKESGHIGDSIGRSSPINNRFCVISTESDIRVLNEDSRRRNLVQSKQCDRVDDEEDEKCNENQNESALSSDELARASWIAVAIHRDAASSCQHLEPR
jgi:hypothetical protein